MTNYFITYKYSTNSGGMKEKSEVITGIKLKDNRDLMELANLLKQRYELAQVKITGVNQLWNMKLGKDIWLPNRNFKE